MPATSLCVKEDGIHRYNERSNTSEPVSNFTIKLTASVENTECGSSGFLVLVKQRFPRAMKSRGNLVSVHCSFAETMLMQSQEGM